jgi:hypothetical protein
VISVFVCPPVPPGLARSRCSSSSPYSWAFFASQALYGIDAFEASELRSWETAF